MVHEDTEIITEEGPGDSELPSGGDDEQLTESDEDRGMMTFRGSGRSWTCGCSAMAFWNLVRHALKR
jgi:hypothetical protein